MARFGKSSDSGAPTLGASKAKTILSDGTVRGKKLTPKQRGLFGAIAGGAKLRKGGGKAKGGGGGESSRSGYGKPPAMGGSAGAGNLDADTKKYGAMMKGRK
jgi:hypothetical protein